MVLVQWRKKPDPANPAPEPKAAGRKGRAKAPPPKLDGYPDFLGGRFMNPDVSSFRVEVKAGENTVEPIDVSKDPAPAPSGRRRAPRAMD